MNGASRVKVGIMHNTVKSEIKANNANRRSFVEGHPTEAPNIFFSAHALATIKEIVKTNGEEVGWYCIVESDTATNSIHVVDVVYPKQVLANAATCEFDEGDVVELAMMKPGGPSNIEKIRFWGHSHHTMGVSPSSQDDKQAEVLASRSGETGLFIRGIFNKMGSVGLTAYCGKTLRKWDKLSYSIVGTLETSEDDIAGIRSIVDSTSNPFEIREKISQYVFKSESAIVDDVKSLNERNAAPKKSSSSDNFTLFSQYFSAPEAPVHPTDFSVDPDSIEALDPTDIELLANYADEGDPVATVLLKLVNYLGLIDRIEENDIPSENDGGLYFMGLINANRFEDAVVQIANDVGLDLSTLSGSDYDIADTLRSFMGVDPIKSKDPMDILRHIVTDSYFE